MYHQYLANALAYRGHIHEAYATDRRLLLDPKASRFTWFLDPFLVLALLGAIPESLAASNLWAGVRAWQQRGRSLRFNIQARQLRGLPWWLARRDTAVAGAVRAPRRAGGSDAEKRHAASSAADTSTRPRPRISRWLEPIPSGRCVSFNRSRTRSAS